MEPVEERHRRALHEAPLVVEDLKRRENRFVILDHAFCERLAGRTGEVETRGLDSSDHDWARVRALERPPSRVATPASVGDLRRIPARVRRRPRLSAAWQGATVSGPARHGLVATDVVGTIEAFFSLRDRGGPWLSGGTCLAEHCFGRRVSEGSDLFTSDEKLLYTARDVLSTRVRAENAAGGVLDHGTDDPEACRGQ